MKRAIKLLILGMVVTGFWAATAAAAALDPGATYTVEVYPITSSGTVGARSSSDQAKADDAGKLTFQFTNLPNFPAYNFLLIRIKDGSGTIVRQGIAPAPKAGEQTLLGISPASVSQTKAMLKAMEDAGSDDPVMVLFGFTLIRTGALEDPDIEAMGVLAREAVLNGFNAYLEGKIGATKMQAFRNAVQNRLGAYTAKIKELIDSADAGQKQNFRGEAGAMLSAFLVEAAAAAGFDPALIPPAMKAMSDRAETHAPFLSDGMTACMDVVMASTYLKVMAEVVKQKYSSGLGVLGASADQISRMNLAINGFSNALVGIFADFESLFENEEEMPTVEALENKREAMQDAFMVAFNTFMTASASTVEELDAMVASLKNGLCPNMPNRANCEEGIDDLKGESDDYLGLGGFFQVRNLLGQPLRWPIPMVVAVKWVVDHYPTEFHYTRDDLEPAPQHWLNDRSDYDPSSDMPSVLADILGLREDIEIVYGRRMAGEIAASCDITQAAWDALSEIDQLQANFNFGDRLTIREGDNTANQDDQEGLNTALVPNFNHCDDMAPFLNGYELQGLEDLLLERLETLKENIGPEAVTEAQRQALIDVLSAPRFR